ncbi:MAG: diaminopimelate decarboxylase [Trueperaceae bacterium]|nr:diaminopimelate decarboxylase [Trueperaceae bacterium]
MNDLLLERIAHEFGTPCYVYDLDQISHQVDVLREALTGARLFYAVKANPCGAILKNLATKDVGAEVISMGELERAVHAGIKPENIVLGGPRQDTQLIGRALDLGVRLFSIDSVSQWESWKPFLRADLYFVLRVNPALDPRTHEHLATGAAESKFGLTFAETRVLASEVQAHAQLAGFHVHAGSQITATEVYDEIFEVLEPLYNENPNCRYLDIGGGYGVPGFELEAFRQRVLAFAQKFELQVILEPGRFLVAEAGVLLTSVLHHKAGALHHIIADAGMADLLRPALYGAKHPIRVLHHAPAKLLADVDGPLCENADRLARNVNLPELKGGEILVVEQAGAYGFAMSSNYASSYRPAEVVIQGGQYRLARQRESLSDLIRLELL